LSTKHNLVLYIDQELVEKSLELGFNLSKLFENHLKHLLKRTRKIVTVASSKKILSLFVTVN